MGIKRQFSEWMEFKGCIDRSSTERPFVNCNSDTCKVTKDSKDPFMDCYSHCPAHQFMLTREMCVCNNETIPPTPLPVSHSKNIISGRSEYTLCMYAPAPINDTLFKKKPDGNCLYVYTNKSDLIFGNAKCYNTEMAIVLLFEKEKITS